MTLRSHERATAKGPDGHAPARETEDRAPGSARAHSSLRSDLRLLLLLNVLLLACFGLWEIWQLELVSERLQAQQELLSLRDALNARLREPVAPATPETDAAATTALLPELRELRDRWRDDGAATPELEAATTAAVARASSALIAIDGMVATARQRMGWGIAVFLAAFLLLLAWAAWSLRRQLLRPLAALAGRAERLAAGLPDHGVLTKGARRELRVIGRALDGIAERDHRLSELLNLDEATGLPNRRAARQCLSEWVRDGKSGALLLLRVINLGGIRAVYGEAHANAVLYRYAHEVRDAAESFADIVATYAEDTLILLVPSGREGAEAALADVVSGLMSAESERGTREEVLARPELVAAIALFPAHGDTVDAVIGQATTALDNATVRGPGTIERARAADHGVLRRHLAHHETLRQTLESDNLELWFMPIVDVSDSFGRIAHVEALMRMRGDDGEVYPVPGEMMERLLGSPDLLLPASERCFTYACEVLGQMRAAGHDIGMAFNLSAPELRDEHLARLTRIFIESGLPPASLTLEITERAALRGLDQLVPRLQGARERGVRVTLDDFGTGFSSLSHLVELPIDGIKIDRVFVSALLDDERSREIVAATTALAQVLKLEVVVEGVETEAQCNRLVELGCPIQQGYLHGKAMPLEQLMLRLAAGF